MIKLEVVCVPANSLCHCEGSEIAMGNLCEGCVVWISLASKYTLSTPEPELSVGWSYIFLGLRKHGPGL